MPEPLELLEPRRLLTAYAVDRTWGSGGIGSGDGSPAVYVRGERIVTQSTHMDEIGSSTSTVFRFHLDGTPDRSFRAIVQEGFDDNAALVGVDAAARPLLDASGISTARLLRYKPTGGRDRSFDGRLSPPGAGGLIVQVVDAAPQPDGSLLVSTRVLTPPKDGTGQPTSREYLSRLSAADGTLDPAFATNGYCELGPVDAMQNVAVAGDTRGRVYVRLADGVLRLRQNGSRDKAYGTNGVVAWPAKIAGRFALDAAGRLVAFASNGKSVFINRFDSRGRPDDAFNANVKAALASVPVADPIVLPQADGTLYVQLGDRLLRLSENGTRDSTFDGDGQIEFVDKPGDSGGAVLTPLPGGRFLRKYYEDVRAMAPYQAVVAAGGWLTIDGTDANDSVAVRADGRFLRVSLNGQVTRVPAAGILSLTATLGDGDNVFTSALPIDMVVNGGSGRDVIYSGSGRDNVNAGEGDDTLASGDGYDQLAPGGGRNFTDLGRGGGSVWVYPAETPGRNVLLGRGGREKLRVYVENDSPFDIRLTGSDVDISLNGNADDVVRLAMTGETYVLTGDGDDQVDTTGDGLNAPAYGADLIDAGRGRDTVRTGRGRDKVFVGLAPAEPDPAGDDDVYDLGPGIDVCEDLYGNNQIFGGGDSDFITTGPGRDTLDGGNGDDSLRAEDGDDSLVGGAGNDTLVGGRGRDTLRAGNGDDTIYAGFENFPPFSSNVLDGGSGFDRYRRETDDDVLSGVEIELASGG